MTDNKYYVFECPDGRLVAVPAAVIVNHAQKHGRVRGEKNYTANLLDGEVIYWAVHYMNWQEVQEHAMIIRPNQRPIASGFDFNDVWASPEHSALRELLPSEIVAQTPLRGRGADVGYGKTLLMGP